MVSPNVLRGCRCIPPAICRRNFLMFGWKPERSRLPPPSSFCGAPSQSSWARLRLGRLWDPKAIVSKLKYATGKYCEHPFIRQVSRLTDGEGA
jgi:hypothetical protein